MKTAALPLKESSPCKGFHRNQPYLFRDAGIKKLIPIRHGVICYVDWIHKDIDLTALYSFQRNFQVMTAHSYKTSFPLALIFLRQLQNTAVEGTFIIIFQIDKM